MACCFRFAGERLTHAPFRLYSAPEPVVYRAKTMDTGVRRCTFTPAAAVLLLFACSTAIAQLPAIPGLTPQKTEVAPRTEATETSEQRQARIHKLLDEARQLSEHP